MVRQATIYREPKISDQTMSILIKQYNSAKISAGKHIEIHWDIFNMCDYHCTYCYMRRENEWNKIADWAMQQEYISKMATTELPIYLKLIGGEPTLHPHFKQFINLLHTALYKTNALTNSITIISNNSNADRLTSVDKNICSDINLILTFHSEEAEVDPFIDNIFKLVEHGYQNIQVSVMAHFNKLYHSKLSKLISILKEYNIKFMVSYITVHNKLAKLNEEYYKSLSELDDHDLKYQFEYNDHIETYSSLTLRDAIKQGKTKFKGWNCQLNEYHISVYGKITQRCVGTAYNIDNIIKKDNDFTVTCPNEDCIHDCFLGFVKTPK